MPTEIVSKYYQLQTKIPSGNILMNLLKTTYLVKFIKENSKLRYSILIKITSLLMAIIKKYTRNCYLKSRHKAANACICDEYTSEMNQCRVET